MLREASESQRTHPSRTSDLSEVARSLGEARSALREIEATALSAVAESLAATTAALAETVTRLEAQRPEEWMTPGQAAVYLGMTRAAFDKIAKWLPRRYLSERVVLYPRSLIDEALLEATDPQASVVNCRRDDKISLSDSPRRSTGAAESLRKAGLGG